LTLLRPMATDLAHVGPLPTAELANWGLVRLQLEQWAQLLFTPTVICRTQEDAGESLWSASLGQKRLGVAFRWSVMEPGILVLSDIAAIQTNALLMDSKGLLSETMHTVHLNTALHQLNWQSEVLGRFRQ
jgi:hypothetical protein